MSVCIAFVIEIKFKGHFFNLKLILIGDTDKTWPFLFEQMMKDNDGMVLIENERKFIAFSFSIVWCNGIVYIEHIPWILFVEQAISVMTMTFSEWLNVNRVNEFSEMMNSTIFVFFFI